MNRSLWPPFSPLGAWSGLNEVMLYSAELMRGAGLAVGIQLSALRAEREGGQVRLGRGISWEIRVEAGWRHRSSLGSS